MEEEQLAEELKEKRICRFCLTQTEPLSDIFEEPGGVAAAAEKSKKLTPLTLQIMACVSIEVFKDDGMPATICDNCRALMDHSYRFKQICKKADTLLKTYPLTGVWPERLQVPVNLFKTINVPAKVPPKPPVKQLPVAKEVPQRKAPPAAKPAPIKQTITVIPGFDKPTQSEYEQETEGEEEEPQPMEQTDDDPLADVKPKIVKLSIEDLRNIKQGKPINKTQLIKKSPPAKKNKIQVLHTEVIVPSSDLEPPVQRSSVPKAPRSTPKVINGSLATNSQPILLNSLKTTKQVTEHFLHTSEGTLEIVTTEMLEKDPMKIAPPVETDVFPCTECERSFPLRQLLDIHMQNHNRERNFPCEMCDKRFFSKYDLAKHNLTHTGERPYVCIICKAAFSRSTLLTRHQRIHKDTPKYLCMFCERTFLSNEELQKHAENHQKVRPFKCKRCPKSFAYKQGLERHEVTHDKNLPFPCEHCDLSFATAGKLARHLTAHAGTRPYPCRWCNRSFMLSHHLTRHVRSHEGGKGAYRCSECTDVFYSQDELIYHSAKHATESKSCPLCREQFESLEEVTEHIKHHSEGVQYACDYCDLLFTSEQRLEDHCQIEHLSVLATETDEPQVATARSRAEVEEDSQQYIIEEIAINNDGSKTITKFVDGEVTEKKLVRKAIKCEDEEDAITYTQEELDAEDNNQEEDGFLEDDWAEDELESHDTTTEIVTKVTQKAPVTYKPGVSKMEVSKPVTSTPASKSTQKKLDSFFKKAEPSGQKTVSEVLQKLPKGVVVKRPTAVVKPETSSPANQPKKTPPPPQKRPSEPEKPPKTSPRLVGKRPREDLEPPAPAKKVAPELKPTLPKPSPTAGEVKKGKTFEMKIGNKMVKVQKVVMTKAEVAAMARDGKIEMQGDTMILKQPKGKK